MAEHVTGFVSASGGSKVDFEARLNAVTRGLRLCGVPRFDGDSARMFSIEIL